MRDSALANQFNKVSLLPEYLPNVSQDIGKKKAFLGLGEESCSLYGLVWIENHNPYSHFFKVRILEISI